MGINVIPPNFVLEKWEDISDVLAEVIVVVDKLILQMGLLRCE